MAQTPDHAATALDFTRMTKVQKLAALLVILGPDSAGQLMRHFDEHELEAVSGEMAKLTFISQELQQQVLRSSPRWPLRPAPGSAAGSIWFATPWNNRSACSAPRISSAACRPMRAPPPDMQSIVEMEPQQIHNLIKDEQAQTIALVISYLAPGPASVLLGHAADRPAQPGHRAAGDHGAHPDRGRGTGGRVLNQKLGGKHTRALSQTGGLKTAAELLNAMDKNLSKALLVTLEERNPELGAAIRQKMFTFEDLTSLDRASIQKVLREVEMHDLAVALKTASDELKTLLLSSISKRAAETVNEEISFMGALKLRDIEGAQNRIIEAVRRLEAEGEIELGNRNDMVHEASRRLKRVRLPAPLARRCGAACPRAASAREAAVEESGCAPAYERGRGRRARRP
jgi:flagellar motor switch protein FliG